MNSDQVEIITSIFQIVQQLQDVINPFLSLYVITPQKIIVYTTKQCFKNWSLATGYYSKEYMCYLATRVPA